MTARLGISWLMAAVVGCLVASGVGTAPDVAQLAQVWPRSFGAAGALRPLDDLIAKTNIGVAGWDQYVARDMQQGPDGKTYAIRFTVDTSRWPTIRTC